MLHHFFPAGHPLAMAIRRLGPDSPSVQRAARPAFIAGGINLAGICLLAAGAVRPAVAQLRDVEPGTQTAAAQVYLDDTARRLMEGARAARDSALLDIESYTAVVRERGSFEAAVLVRDRPVVRFESATRVRWSRDGPMVLRALGSPPARASATSGWSLQCCGSNLKHSGWYAPSTVRRSP